MLTNFWGALALPLALPLALALTSCEDSSVTRSDRGEYPASMAEKKKFIGVWQREANLEQTMTIALNEEAKLVVTDDSTNRSYPITQVSENRLLISFKKEKAQWGVILDGDKLILRTNTQNKEVFVKGMTKSKLGDLYKQESLKEQFSALRGANDYKEIPDIPIPADNNKKSFKSPEWTQFDRNGNEIKKENTISSENKLKQPALAVIVEEEPNNGVSPQFDKPAEIIMQRHGRALFHWQNDIPFYRKTGVRKWTEGLWVSQGKYQFEVSNSYIMEIDFNNKRYNLKYAEEWGMTALKGSWFRLR